MRHTRNFLFAAVTLVALAAAALPSGLHAQRGPPSREGGQDRQAMEARVRQAMAHRMQEELGLTDEEFLAMEERTQPFQERRRTLARRESATRLRISAYVQDGGREGEAEELLAALADLRSQELTLFQEELEALAEILDPEQRLRFIIVREQMNQRIRRARAQNQGNRPGPPGGGESRRPEDWDAFGSGGIDLPLALW